MMTRRRGFGFGLVVCLCLAFGMMLLVEAQLTSYKPVTKCVAARATWYGIHRVNNVPQGTCAFGPVADDMPQAFRDGFVVAPDDETYNTARKYISQGGLGLSCGECVEIAGPKGTIFAFVADICDFPGQQNCGGSQNKDYPDINVDNAVWSRIYIDDARGATTINYRKVECNLGGKNLSLYFDAVSDPNPFYFRFYLYNYRVGIRRVQIFTGGSWRDLKREWTNGWVWENSGAVQFPFKIRAYSVLNTTSSAIEFPQSFTESSYAKGNRFNSLKQFPRPKDNFNSAGISRCKWAGPSPVIYRNGLGSLAKIKWADWDPWGGAQVNYAGTTGCFSGQCAIVSGFGSTNWGFQFGSTVRFGRTFFKNLTFRAKVASGTFTGLQLVWDCASQSSNVLTVPGSITTSWKLFNITTTSWTHPANCFQALKWMGNSNPGTLYLDDVILTGAASGTGWVTGKTPCSQLTSTTCGKNANFYCTWTGSTCVDNFF